MIIKEIPLLNNATDKLLHIMKSKTIENIKYKESKSFFLLNAIDNKNKSDLHNFSQVIHNYVSKCVQHTLLYQNI